MLWKLFGSEHRVNKALRQKTQVSDLSPSSLDALPEEKPKDKVQNWMDIAYGAANADMAMIVEFDREMKKNQSK